MQIPRSDGLNVSACLLHVVYFDIAAFILVSFTGSVSELLIEIDVLFASRAYEKFKVFWFVIAFNCFHKCRTDLAILIVRMDSQPADVCFKGGMS